MSGPLERHPDDGTGGRGTASSMSVEAVVGREEELRSIAGFLDRTASGPSAIVLQGIAGIGKTTLWLAGLNEARERGHVALVTRAAESDARMSYAALGDLLATVPDAILDDLPWPMRRALNRAVLRGGDGGAEAGAPDPRAVSLATGQVLHALAASRPVVVAIDDVQWLDRPSARVLSFVFRRLARDRIGVLESLRMGSGAPRDPIETSRTFVDCELLAIGPLTVGALGRIVRQRTGRALSRPYVVRLHEATGGNPLFALEIARSGADPVAAARPGERLSVPEDIQRVFSARLARVPVPAHRALLAVAATSQPTWELVREVAGSSQRSLAGLARAEEAGIIERVDGRVRFTHPLLASTVYLNAGEGERRAIHRLLATLTTDPEEAARHLALAMVGPDEAVAEALERAARHARARGAPDAAAELAERSSAVTPPADEARLRRRRIAAAEYHFDAGDAALARQMLADAIAAAPPGVERAGMLSRLAEMSWMNLVDGVRAPSEQALAEAGDDAGLACGIHISLAWVAIYLADLPTAVRHARKAVELAGSAPGVGPGVRGDALATLEIVSFLEGRPDPALMDEAIRLQDVAMQHASWTESSVYTTPRSMRGLELVWSGRLDAARAILEHELSTYDDLAMFTARHEVLCYLAELESRAGRWPLAASYAAEAMDTVVESGQTATQAHVALFNQAWAAALLGDVDEAREMATAGVEHAEANGDLFNAAWNHAVLGFLELSLSAFEAARPHLAEAADWLERLGSVEPGVIPCLPDLVETLVALGRSREAVPIVARLEARAADRDRPSAAGTAARGRALIAAAAGDLEGAAQAAARSIAELDRASQPFETARSWLVLGQIQRRAKQKRLARDALGRARDSFAELGARLWVERAEAELRRIGGRTPSPFELSETEASVAALVARGLTNREAADALFISPGTVQTSLKRIYQKLGVRSRTELAARMARPTPD